MLTKYSPSGKNGPLIYPLVLPMLAGIAVTSFIYVLASHWIPFIYIDALLVFGFAVVSMTLLTWVLRVGKSRNPVTAYILAGIAGVASVVGSHYFSYAYATWGVSTHVPFIDYLSIVTQRGWTLGRHGSGIPITGFWVYIIWAIEGVILLAAPFLAASTVFTPYCENCNRSADEPLISFTIPGLSDPSINAISHASSIDAILMPPLAEIKPTSPLLNYSLLCCPDCRQQAFLSLERIDIKSDKKGQPDKSTSKLGRAIVLSGPEVEAVRQLATDVQALLNPQQPGASPAPAAPIQPTT